MILSSKNRNHLNLARIQIFFIVSFITYCQTVLIRVIESTAHISYFCMTSFSNDIQKLLRLYEFSAFLNQIWVQICNLRKEANNIYHDSHKVIFKIMFAVQWSLKYFRTKVSSFSLLAFYVGQEFLLINQICACTTINIYC